MSTDIFDKPEPITTVRDVLPGEAPYVVDVKAPGATFPCPGSILSKRYVLSPAHCLPK